MTCPACGRICSTASSFGTHVALAHREQYVAIMLDTYTDDAGGPDACHLWTGTLNAKGYGVLYVEWRQRIVTRLVLDAPAGMLACHRCDNPPCVNRRHLYLGSAADNQGDKATRGRAAVANNGGGGKLTWDDVRAIRRDASTTKQLAARYGVSTVMIRRILAGRAWKEG